MISDPVTYLRRDNPRLLQLEADYAALNLPFRHTQWKEHQYKLGLENFRSDGAYLGQGALHHEPQYRAMYEYVKSIDRFHYLDRLTEDGAFGVLTYEYDGKVISRDLCDSIMEMYAIYEMLGEWWPDLPFLDIGSGYGRLAYRLAYGVGVPTYCVDAVATSTFLCEFYLAYRDLSIANAVVVPLPDLDLLNRKRFSLATNIHSWSECSSSAIDFWLDKLIAWKVPYLFVTPHDERWVCVNEDGSIGNFKGNILSRGWEEIASWSKYPDGVGGLYPEVHYHMFRREV